MYWRLRLLSGITFASCLRNTCELSNFSGCSENWLTSWLRYDALKHLFLDNPPPSLSPKAFVVPSGGPFALATTSTSLDACRVNAKQEKRLRNRDNMRKFKKGGRKGTSKKKLMRKMQSAVVRQVCTLPRAGGNHQSLPKSHVPCRPPPPVRAARKWICCQVLSDNSPARWAWVQRETLTAMQILADNKSNH